MSTGLRFQLRIKEDRHPRLRAYVEDRQFYWSREVMDLLEAMLSVFSHTEMHLLVMDLRRNPDLLLRLKPGSAADAPSPSLQADDSLIAAPAKATQESVQTPPVADVVPPPVAHSPAAVAPAIVSSAPPAGSALNGAPRAAPDNRVLEAWAKVFPS